MDSLYFLIPLSLVLIGVAVAIFFWAVKSGQYDDLDSEGERILFEEDEFRAAKKQPVESPQPEESPQPVKSPQPAEKNDNNG